MTPLHSWPAPLAAAPVRAEVSVPGSKSLTNRYLVIAALATDESHLDGILDSRDTRLMMSALSALGAEFTTLDSGTVEVSPIPLHRPGAADADQPAPEPVRIDCGLAGTVMRFVPPVAVVTGRAATFDGDEAARVRPMSTILDALGALGVEVDSAGGFLPFTVRPAAEVRGGHIDIDASASSQFVSGLLLSAPRFDLGLDIRHTGAVLPSRPHIEMTVETLRDAGVTVSEPEEGRWVVEPGAPRGIEVRIEPDLSNAATFVAAALVTGGTVTIPGWPAATSQAGDAIREIAQQFGGSAVLTREGLTVSGPAQLKPVELDLSQVGELTPVVAAVAALTKGRSRLYGIGHLRGHETDRLAALAAEFGKLGAQVVEGEDYLEFLSPARHGAEWATYADHRMVMAGAVMGLRIPQVTVLDPGTVAKTLPDFTRLWEQMVGS